jgi:hypothetical protein
MKKGTKRQISDHEIAGILAIVYEGMSYDKINVR